MINLKNDKYLNIVNEEKLKRGLDKYSPLYPILRMYNGELYVGVMLTFDEDNVWNKNGDVKPEYWVLIDIFNDKIIEFNKTKEKDFVIGNLILRNNDNKQKEISKYTVEKALQYKNYLIEDIKNSELPIQTKLASILNNEFTIDGNRVNINEYVMANIEPEINEKVDELVKLLVDLKYGSLIFYYDELFDQIISSYKENKTVDKDKLKVCLEIMNNYYDGVVGFNNFFNIDES